jgi:3D (Asp-Asp-Asp) domain-containing protein
MQSVRERIGVNRTEKDVSYLVTQLGKPANWIGLALFLVLIALVMDVMGINLSGGQVVPLSRSVGRYDSPDAVAFTLESVEPIKAIDPLDFQEASVMLQLDQAIARHNDLVLEGVYNHSEAEYVEPKQDQSEWVTLRMRVTGYCSCRRCCGRNSDGYTANMHRIRWGDKFVAADKMFSFGREMIIPGYNNGRSVKVMDRGRVIKGYRLDLYFDTHSEAKRWGVKYLDVKVKRR